MRNIFISTILMTLFICCDSNENVKQINSFPVTTPIRCQKKISIDSVFMSYPILKIDGNYCCIADMATREYFFHLYSYPSFKYVKSFGAVGKGSNELVMLTDFDFHDGVVTALCGADYTIKLFNINTPQSPKVIKPQKKNDYSAICNGCDNTFYLYSITGDKRILRIDTCGKVLSEGLKAESLKKEYPRMTPNYVWQSRIRRKDDVVVVPTICGDIIDMANINLEPIIRIKGSIGEPCVKEVAFKCYTSYMLQYQTYIDAVLSKQIYTLYMCEDLSEYPNGKMRNSIRVFDYQANPIKELLLEKDIEASSFYVDESTKKIYVLVPDSDKPIWVYEM